MSERTYYAIGDIHGEAERLGVLHRLIAEDSARHGRPQAIVHVGDLIDRGPDSAGVIERIMRFEQQGEVITLKGNHEQMMLDAYDDGGAFATGQWTVNGGEATILSYLKRDERGEDDWRRLAKRHIAWLRALPTIFFDEARKIAFVHGGIDPATFPNCSDEVRMWTRTRRFFDTETWPARPELDGLLVVHGHTPTEDFTPDVVPRRINIDTGVCYGGPLTCVVLAPGEGPRFMQA